MSKFISYFSAFLTILFFSLSFAEEQLTITTYYPSPYGSYSQLRANQMSIGSNYNNIGTTLPTDGLIVQGNVGIGTSSAGQRLQISGAQAGVVFNLNDITNAAVVEAFNPTNSADKRPILLNPWGGNVGIGYAGSPAERLIVKGSTNTNTAYALKVWNSVGTDMLAVRNDGMIGIGTASPSARLDIQSGGVPFRINSATIRGGNDGIDALYFKGPSSTPNVFVFENSAGDNIASIKENGNLRVTGSISFTSPSYSWSGDKQKHECASGEYMCGFDCTGDCGTDSMKAKCCRFN